MRVEFISLAITGLVLSVTGCGRNEEPNGVNEVMDEVMSTPEGRANVDRAANKEIQLTEFQEANGISNRIAEAAIKEWVIKHKRFGYDLDEVKVICLRNKRDGIPYEYLPESEKRK